MVPKVREYVKGNESCYAETHLYEVLIHDVGLYIYSWMYCCHAHGGHHVETCTNIVHVLDMYLVTCTNVITTSFHHCYTTKYTVAKKRRTKRSLCFLCASAVGLGYF